MSGRQASTNGGFVARKFLPPEALTLDSPYMRLALYLRWKALGGPTTLHYRRLTPNYTRYWMADSDAVNSLDQYETALWFLSRGDECLTCRGSLHGLMGEAEPLLIKIHKAGATSN